MLQTYELQCNQGIGKSRNFCFYPIPSIPNPTQPYGFPTGTAGIPYNSHSHCRKCKLVPFPTLIGLGREWEWELRVGNDTLPVRGGGNCEDSQCKGFPKGKHHNLMKLGP